MFHAILSNGRTKYVFVPNEYQLISSKVIKLVSFYNVILTFDILAMITFILI